MATARGRFLVRVGVGVSNRLSHRRCLLIATFLVTLLGIGNTASAAVSKVGLFRTQELHSANLVAFPKWREMLTRFEQEMAECTPDRCRLDEWRQLVGSLQGQKPTTQLKLVNKAINQHRYVEDWANWDLADYWETPLQFRPCNRRKSASHSPKFIRGHRLVSGIGFAVRSQTHACTPG